MARTTLVFRSAPLLPETSLARAAQGNPKKKITHQQPHSPKAASEHKRVWESTKAPPPKEKKPLQIQIHNSFKPNTSSNNPTQRSKQTQNRNKIIEKKRKETRKQAQKAFQAYAIILCAMHYLTPKSHTKIHLAKNK
jgi:hypothetical protein